MAAELQIKQHQAGSATEAVDRVQGEKGAPQSQSGPNGDAAVTQTLLTILQDYEKTKAALMEALVKNANNARQNLKGSALGQVLENNPLWQAVSSNSGVSDVSYTPSDVQNFFFLIFKFLRDHSDGDAKMEVTQAMNMVAQEGMLDAITQESTQSLNNMEVQIHKADEKAHSPLAMFLKIGLPILLAVVTIIVSVVSFGAAAPAAASADSITTGATEGITEGISDAVANGVEQGIEQFGTQIVQQGEETTLDDSESLITEQVTANLNKEVLRDAIKEGITQGLDTAGKGASEQAVENAVQQSVQRLVGNAVRQAVTDALETVGAEDPATISETVVKSIATTVTKQITEEASEEVINEAVEQATAKTVLQKIAAWCTAKGIGAAGLTAALAGVDTGVSMTFMNQPQTEETNTINTATSVEQGTMAVNSAASDAVQNDLKQGMQYQQNEQSEQQSDESMLQQTIQSMTKVFYIGSY